VKRDRPKYVYEKGPKKYLYFCRKGQKPIRMTAKIGTADFAAEYAMLLRGRQAGPNRTIRKLIDHYLKSEKWAPLAHNTRRSYKRHFYYFDDVMGGVDPASLRRVHINEMRDALSATPTDANRKVSALSVLMEHAIDIGWLRENPALGVRQLKTKRPPRQPWPEDKIRAFREAADPLPLLIFEMLLGTGQRISDVLAIEWGHIEGGGINLRQKKTGTGLWVPLTDHLKALLDATPRRGATIISQENGRPLAYNTAWAAVMKVRKAIGAEAYDNHALRHSAASEIASIPGMRAEHVQAITGHSSAAMVKLYAGKAQQRARALEVGNARRSKRER